MFFDAKLAGQASKLLRSLLRQRAIAALLRRLADEPDRPELHEDLGGLFAEQKEAERALECFARAAHLYLLAGREEAAVDASARSCALFPELPALRSEAAQAYVGQARTVEAVYCLLAGALQQLEHSSWDAAVDLLHEAAELAPLPLAQLAERCPALQEESPWRQPLLAMARAAERRTAEISAAAAFPRLVPVEPVPEPEHLFEASQPRAALRR